MLVWQPLLQVSIMTLCLVSLKSPALLVDQLTGIIGKIEQKRPEQDVTGDVKAFYERLLLYKTRFPNWNKWFEEKEYEAMPYVKLTSASLEYLLSDKYPKQYLENKPVIKYWVMDKKQNELSHEDYQRLAAKYKIPPSLIPSDLQQNAGVLSQYINKNDKPLQLYSLPRNSCFLAGMLKHEIENMVEPESIIYVLQERYSHVFCFCMRKQGDSLTVWVLDSGVSLEGSLLFFAFACVFEGLSQQISMNIHYLPFNRQHNRVHCFTFVMADIECLLNTVNHSGFYSFASKPAEKVKLIVGSEDFEYNSLEQQHVRAQVVDMLRGQLMTLPGVEKMQEAKGFVRAVLSQRIAGYGEHRYFNTEGVNFKFHHFTQLPWGKYLGLTESAKSQYQVTNLLNEEDKQKAKAFFRKNKHTFLLHGKLKQLNLSAQLEALRQIVALVSLVYPML